MIIFDPLIPLALWFPLALLAGVMLAVYAFGSLRTLAPGRWRGVLGLMTLAVMLPLVVLLNPQWVENLPPPPGKPLLTVLVDRTASMATSDVASEDTAPLQTRFAMATDWTNRVAATLGEDIEVRVRTFSDSSAEVPLSALAQQTPDATITDLAATLEGALGEDRPQGQALLLVSDGIDTSAAPGVRLRDVADKAKAFNVPILTRTLGTQQEAQDLELVVGISQELAFVQQRIPVTFQLRYTGNRPAQTQVSLSLHGETIESQDVTLRPGSTGQAIFYVSQPESGLYRYRAEAKPIPGEVTELNNVATLLLRVVDEPVRVLLLEGKPYWDTKFLVRTLSADQSMELVSVVQVAPGRLLERRISLASPPKNTTDGQEAADGEVAEKGANNTIAPQAENQWEIHADARSFLADKQRLAGFQIVVLGRNTESFLTDEAVVELRRWVQSGEGSLVCFRGPPTSQISQRLGAMLPVRWSVAGESHYRAEFTETGEALNWLPEEAGRLSSLPSLAASSEPGELKPLATVLVSSQGDHAPLFTYRPEGKGRVVVIEGAGMWRWAFLSPNHQQHDEVFGTLWRSLIRWLVSNVGLLPGETIALRPDAVTFRSTQPATATLLLREDAWDEPPLVTLTGEELSEPVQATPLPQDASGGVYRVSFGKLPAGSYVAETSADAGQSVRTTFEVTENIKERLAIAARPDVMAELANRSGGLVLTTGDPQAVATAFEQHWVRSRPERVMRTAAWDRWWLLLGIFGVWATTWGVRRWSGLI